MAVRKTVVVLSHMAVRKTVVGEQLSQAIWRHSSGAAVGKTITRVKMGPRN